MSALPAIEQRLAQLMDATPSAASAPQLLELAEQVLESWVRARGETPTLEEREGFRLLGLHRQGSQGAPSFNACRESCREIIYHYNLLRLQPEHPQGPMRALMMGLLVNHLCLFVIGKIQSEGLGEFCCASRPLRTGTHADQ